MFNITYSGTGVQREVCAGSWEKPEWWKWQRGPRQVRWWGRMIGDHWESLPWENKETWLWNEEVREAVNDKKLSMTRSWRRVRIWIDQTSRPGKQTRWPRPYQKFTRICMSVWISKMGKRRLVFSGFFFGGGGVFMYRHLWGSGRTAARGQSQYPIRNNLNPMAHKIITPGDPFCCRFSLTVFSQRLFNE